MKNCLSKDLSKSSFLKYFKKLSVWKLFEKNVKNTVRSVKIKFFFNNSVIFLNNGHFEKLFLTDLSKIQNDRYFFFLLEWLLKLTDNSF